MEGQGETVVVLGGQMKVGSSGGYYVTLRRKLTNEGSVVFEAGTLYLGQNGLLQNKGTFEVKDGTYISLTDNLTRQTIVNKGTFLKASGSGTANINVNLRNEGKVQIEAGTLRVNGDYYQPESGILEIGISGTQAGQFGKIAVNNGWLNGKLLANILGDFAPPVGTNFQVLTGQTLVGDFRDYDLPGDFDAGWQEKTLNLTVKGGFFLSRVEPKEIPNRGTVQITLRGSGFKEGTTISLVQENITVDATSVIIENRRLLKAQFSLNEITAGFYDIIARSSEGEEAKLEGQIQVYDAGVLSIISVSPDPVVLKPHSIITFRVTGTQFSNDCQVYFQRQAPNEAPLNPQSFRVISPQEIEVTFDLTQAKIGPYELIVQKGDQKANYRMHFLPYFAVITHTYHRPSFLVVGRVTRQVIEFTNSGSAPGVAVFGLLLPEGFELVNVNTGFGGEWGQTSDGVIVIAQPVEAGETVSVTVDVRLPWDKVSVQPEEGKYRLGDTIVFKGTLIAYPIKDVWHLIRAGSTWDDIVARAMVGYGTIRNLYLEELEELTMDELTVYSIVLSIFYPDVAPIFVNALETNLMISMLGENIGTRSPATGSPTRIVEGIINLGRDIVEWGTLATQISFWKEVVQSYLDDISSSNYWKAFGVRILAFAEGLLEGFSLGLLDINFSSKLAKCWGLDEFNVSTKTIGNISSWAVPAGLATKTFVKFGIDINKIIAKEGLNTSFKTLLKNKEFDKLAELAAKLDGQPTFRLFGKDIAVYATKGFGDEPKRIFGIDQYVKLPVKGGKKGEFTITRANVFHIGWHEKYGWHVGIGHIRIPIEPGKFPPAGWHFYKFHIYHPKFGQINYTHLTQQVIASQTLLPATPSIFSLTNAAFDTLGDLIVENFCKDETRIVASYDPNSIEVQPIVPYTNTNTPLTFTIHFENLPQANFPAEDIIIKLPLDENLDIDSVTFTGSSHPDVLTTVVDKSSRTIIWRFTGIQLPPNQNPPEGEGWVQFTVTPKENIPSGTEITAKAEIRFDENPPIMTNEVKVTVDSKPPTTQMAALPEVQSRGVFEVQWEAQDDLSGVETTLLWVNEERSDGQQSSYSTPKTRAIEIDGKTYYISYSLPKEKGSKMSIPGKFGYTYRFIATSVDKARNHEIPQQPQAVTTVGRFPQIPQGIRLVAVPVQSEDADPKGIFNFPENKWATWNPMANNGQGGYVLYPSDEVKFSEPERVPGRAYWVRLNEPTTLKIYGPLPDDTQPFVIQLKRGWNLVGNPWLVDLVWNLDALQVQVNGQTKPLKNARGIVEPYAWRWDGNQYQLVFDSTILPSIDDKIPAWEGAWIYAWQDCQLIVPPPQVARTRKGRLAKERFEGWFARLSAQIGDEKGSGFFGVMPESRLSISQPPSPPETQETAQIQVLFLDKEGNTSVADFRSGVQRQHEWDIIVRWGRRQVAEKVDEITLTFDGIGYAPKNVNLWLLDVVTGKRLYMRTQRAYRFTPNEGETSRRFKVIAELGNDRPLRVVGLKATPVRGQGVMIEFTLTKAAQVQAEVLTLTGRRVTVLESGTTRTAGTHRIMWRGVSSEDVAVSKGVYLVRMTATDDEGRQVQAVTTVRLK
jgi:hypothetical protein